MQRQFKLASSEVDSLQAVESELLKERSQLQAKNAELSEEQKKNIIKVKELETSVRKAELSERAWAQEKQNLEVSNE